MTSRIEESEDTLETEIPTRGQLGAKERLKVPLRQVELDFGRGTSPPPEVERLREKLFFWCFVSEAF